MAEFEVTFDLQQPHLDATFELQTYAVDSELSETSTLPVENRVVTKAIQKAADTHFTYEQEEPADTWIINHNLGKAPSVTVVDSADEEQIPDRKVYNNENTVTLYFLAGFKGKAFLN